MRVLVFNTQTEAERMVAAIDKCRAPLGTEELWRNIKATPVYDPDTGIQTGVTVTYDVVVSPVKQWSTIIPLRNGTFGVIWSGTKLGGYAGRVINISGSDVTVPDGNATSLTISDTDIAVQG